MNIKHLIYIMPCLTFGITSNAVALSASGGGAVQILKCEEVTCEGNTATMISLYPETNCNTTAYPSTSYYTEKCYKAGETNYIFRQCKSCASGYSQIDYTPPECGTLQPTTIKICGCSCNNCTSDTTWTAGNTGYEKKVTRTCDCSSGTATCTATTSYRCAAGYYGSSSNGTSGCTQCPEATNIYTNTALTAKARGTSSAGSTSASQCYLQSGTYYDSTGKFEYTSSCYY